MVNIAARRRGLVPSAAPTGAAMLPLLKDYPRQRLGDRVVIRQDTGVDLYLDDAEGQVEALLDLLDGTRTVERLSAELALRWTGLTVEDVADAVIALDEAGLLEDGAAATGLTPWQRQRYDSNLAFFGSFASLDRSRFAYQETLRGSRVVLLGVGGAGSTLLYNLAGLGVGSITIVDHDRVELKNLARQFLYSEADLGESKVVRAAERALGFNSELELETVERELCSPDDIAPLVRGADLVLAAVDRPFAVREWVNSACVAEGVPYVTGGFRVGRGLYYSFDPGRSGCRGCWPEAGRADEKPPAVVELVNRGIGPVASVIASLMALEALRYLTRFAPPVSAGRVWLVDFVTGETTAAFEWDRRPDCRVCGVQTSRPAKTAAP